MTRQEKKEKLRILLYNFQNFSLDEREKEIIKLIPEFESMYKLPHNQPAHQYDIFDHTMAVVDKMPVGDLARVSALLHDIGKPIKRFKGNDGIYHYWGHPEIGSLMVISILFDLGYDFSFAQKISAMVLYHDSYIDKNYEEFLRVARAIGFENLEVFMSLQKADLYSHAEHYFMKYEDQLKKSHERVREFMAKAKADGEF